MSEAAAGPVIEPLTSAHERRGFSSGADELDRYLARQATQDLRRHVAAPFVLIAPETGAIAGYYTLSAACLALAELPSETTNKLPRYPQIPAALLGRLAVDHRFQGRGYGALLLTDALKRALRTSHDIQAFAVIVDARDAAARSFYEHYGFYRLPDQDRRMFLPMVEIEKSYIRAP